MLLIEPKTVATDRQVIVPDFRLPNQENKANPGRMIRKRLCREIVLSGLTQLDQGRNHCLVLSNRSFAGEALLSIQVKIVGFGELYFNNKIAVYKVAEIADI